MGSQGRTDVYWKLCTICQSKLRLKAVELLGPVVSKTTKLDYAIKSLLDRLVSLASGLYWTMAARTKKLDFCFQNNWNNREHSHLTNCLSYGVFIWSCGDNHTGRTNRNLSLSISYRIAKWLVKFITQYATDSYLGSDLGSFITNLMLTTKRKLDPISSFWRSVCNTKAQATKTKRGTDNPVMQSSPVLPKTTSPIDSAALNLGLIWEAVQSLQYVPVHRSYAGEDKNNPK